MRNRYIEEGYTPLLFACGQWEDPMPFFISTGSNLPLPTSRLSTELAVLTNYLTIISVLKKTNKETNN